MIWSCEDPNSIKPLTFESKVVIYTDLNPDSLFNVSLIRSGEKSEIPLEVIRDADVKIYVGEEFLDQLFIPAIADNVEEDPVFVSSDVYPKPNVVYRLEVELPDGQVLSATTQVPTSFRLKGPEHIKINELKVVPTFDSKIQGDSFIFNGAVLIENLDVKENFYHFAEVILHADEFDAPQGDTTLYDHLTPVLEVMNVQPDNQNYISLVHEPGFLLKEPLATAESHEVQFQVGFRWNPDQVLLDHLDIYVRHVSKEYYDYHNKVALQLANRDNPFAEPVRVPTNVDNGLGNFSGYVNQNFKVNFTR